MMRVVFQDSALSEQGGIDRAREGGREGGGRETGGDVFYCFFKYKPSRPWLSNWGCGGHAVLIHINTDLIHNNPLVFNRFCSGTTTQFFKHKKGKKKMNVMFLFTFKIRQNTTIIKFKADK